MKDQMTNANFPTDANGATYHVGTKPGQVANRIVTVGDVNRLLRFAPLLDEQPAPFRHSSSRGYTTITGRYKGVPISLISIGMGVAMMDFMVREVRHVVDGDLAIVRFGSCGSLDPTLEVGAIGVVQNAMTITTNYDHYAPDPAPGSKPFTLSKPIPADPALHTTLLDQLTAAVGADGVRDIALHASADCFYSSQGRTDANFADDNASFIAELAASHPTLTSLEMESAQLLHCARIAAPHDTKGSIHAAACHMVFAGRKTGGEGTFIDPAVVERLEPLVGKACLDAVVAFDLAADKLHPEQASVWAL